MAKRQFRSDDSLKAEAETRDAVAPLLLRHGYIVDDDIRTTRGTAVSQILVVRHLNNDPFKIHVRLCWRRAGRTAREQLYSAAQLRARLVENDWDKTLAFIADREAADSNTHNLFVQIDDGSFRFAALVPSDQLPAIWRKQRDVSATLIASGQTGAVRKNHAENGSSPTIYLQDDRTPATHAVADALWSWPGVINLLTLPTTDGDAIGDSYDDLSVDHHDLGRDVAAPIPLVSSGYPRDQKVRKAVLDRAAGRCERTDCGERRDFRGFLDVHHILGVGFSDRVWSCVALCPNCHREAHFAHDRDAINGALANYARRFTSDS